MQDLVKIKFHGKLGEEVGQEDWELSVSSVSEALRAVDALSQRKLSLTAINYSKQKAKYKILVDEKSVINRDVETKEEVDDCGIHMHRKMKRIDVVPVFEGAKGDDEGTDMAFFIGGALLFTLGLAYGSTIMTTIGLYMMLNGLSNLLSEPPEFEDFREIEQVNKTESYLFDGAINTYNPGGPVPIGYGRLVVGSLTTAFSRTSSDKLVYENGTYYT